MMNTVDHQPADATDGQAGANRRQRHVHEAGNRGSPLLRGRDPGFHGRREVADAPESHEAGQDVGDYQSEVLVENWRCDER